MRGAPVFTSAPVAYPVAGGPVTSAAFTPTAAGTYRWRATYSGDANNAAVTGACNDAERERRRRPEHADDRDDGVARHHARRSATLTDTATVTGRVNPLAGATIVFRLYGPNDATCADAPVFTSAPCRYPVAGGPVTSPAFTPTAPGTYRWRATYSGDANNDRRRPVPCNAAERERRGRSGRADDRDGGVADIALGPATLTDSATVTGRVNPLAGATITFRALRPERRDVHRRAGVHVDGRPTRWRAAP